MDKIYWEARIKLNNSEKVITKEIWTVGNHEGKAKEKAIGEINPIGVVIDIKKIEIKHNIGIGNPCAGN